MLARETIAPSTRDTRPAAPAPPNRPAARASLPPDVAQAGDALAGILSRAVSAGRVGHSGPMLMRDIASAAAALRAANLEKFNKGTYETWLAAPSAPKAKSNAALHQVTAKDLAAVRRAYEALAPAADDLVTDDAKPKRYVGKPAATVTPVATPPVAVVAITRPLASAMTVQYGAEHGKLHFGGKATKKKTKWDLSVTEACALMEAEIVKHRDRLVRESALDKEWEPWYIIADADDDIGRYIAKGETGTTNRFSMQVQVSLQHKLISYHGYPDQRAMDTGAGKGRNAVDD
jgi:hypothetical protein